MTPAETLQRSLDTWTPAVGGSAPHTWSATVPGTDATATVTAAAQDSLATKAWDLSIHRDRAADGSPRRWAEAIAENVSGLQEDLRLLEVDETRHQAILRSDGPTRKGDDAHYYEVEVTGEADAQLRRYQANTKDGTPRQQVPFALTHETLGELIDAIAQS
ncbi:MAG: hypothetical protein ACRCZF_01290 [Gemmataceae bacterium]